MKKLLILISVLYLTGCMGVMNEFDRDAAVAHSKAQQDAFASWLKSQEGNKCTLDIPAGTNFPGLRFSCPTMVAGNPPMIDQWKQPEHPAKPLAAGLGNAISQVPIVVLGGLGFSALKSAANQAGTNTTTTYNQSVTGGSASVKTMGNVNVGNVTGKGNQFGMIDNTSTPTVVHTQVVPVEPVFITEP